MKCSRWLFIVYISILRRKRDDAGAGANAGDEALVLPRLDLYVIHIMYKPTAHNSHLHIIKSQQPQSNSTLCHCGVVVCVFLSALFQLHWIRRIELFISLEFLHYLHLKTFSRCNGEFQSSLAGGLLCCYYISSDSVDIDCWIGTI